MESGIPKETIVKWTKDPQVLTMAVLCLLWLCSLWLYCTYYG